MADRGTTARANNVPGMAVDGGTHTHQHAHARSVPHRTDTSTNRPCSRHSNALLASSRRSTTAVRRWLNKEGYSLGASCSDNHLTQSSRHPHPVLVGINLAARPDHRSPRDTSTSFWSWPPSLRRTRQRYTCSTCLCSVFLLRPRLSHRQFPALSASHREHDRESE